MGGVLAYLSSWMRGLYVLGWPDSRPGLPLRYLVGISKGQQALGELAGGTLVSAGVVMSLRNTFGFALGVGLLAANVLSVGLC